ncbi:DUF551 domain-containing protein [Candidatus Pacearchaeota archaeon]|nr:DUF551 domain-containing protein [Candidatus Pacearchaeota archaeon]
MSREAFKTHCRQKGISIESPAAAIMEPEFEAGYKAALNEIDGEPVATAGDLKMVKLEELDIRPSTPLYTHPAPEEWISVEDRLPDDAVTVLIYFLAPLNSGCGIESSERWKGKWITPGSNACDFITHWQPLPADPVQP